MTCFNFIDCMPKKQFCHPYTSIQLQGPLDMWAIMSMGCSLKYQGELEACKIANKSLTQVKEQEVLNSQRDTHKDRDVWHHLTDFQSQKTQQYQLFVHFKRLSHLMWEQCFIELMKAV